MKQYNGCGWHCTGVPLVWHNYQVYVYRLNRGRAGNRSDDSTDEKNKDEVKGQLQVYKPIAMDPGFNISPI